VFLEGEPPFWIDALRDDGKRTNLARPTMRKRKTWVEPAAPPSDALTGKRAIPSMRRVKLAVGSNNERRSVSDREELSGGHQDTANREISLVVSDFRGGGGEMPSRSGRALESHRPRVPGAAGRLTANDLGIPWLKAFRTANQSCNAWH